MSNKTNGNSSNLSGGANRELLRPHRPNNQKGPYGPHRGAWVTLNIPHPKPGFHYYWSLRNDGVLSIKTNEGWQIVKWSDPEWKGSSFSKEGKSIDTMATVGDLVCLRIPEKDYAKIKQAKNQFNKDVLDGAGGAYMQGNSTYGSSQIRHQSTKHSVRVGSPLDFE